jgi:hypothetical protein
LSVEVVVEDGHRIRGLVDLDPLGFDDAVRQALAP